MSNAGKNNMFTFCFNTPPLYFELIPHICWQPNNLPVPRGSFSNASIVGIRQRGHLLVGNIALVCTDPRWSSAMEKLLRTLIYVRLFDACERVCLVLMESRQTVREFQIALADDHNVRDIIGTRQIDDDYYVLTAITMVNGQMLHKRFYVTTLERTNALSDIAFDTLILYKPESFPAIGRESLQTIYRRVHQCEQFLYALITTDASLRTADVIYPRPVLLDPPASPLPIDYVQLPSSPQGVFHLDMGFLNTAFEPRDGELE